MYNLTAAYLQKIEEAGKNMLRMVTSDGHRLSIMSREAEGLAELEFDRYILIPRRGVQQIRKFCEERDAFQVGIEKKRMVLKSDDAVLVIRLMEGEFPDIENIFQCINQENNININKLLFIESLKRVNLFTEDIFPAIRFEVNNNQLVLTSQNADSGSARDEMDIEYSGKALSIGFNCRYFIDALQVLDGEIIQASVSSDESPCLISSEQDKGFLGIIMPMKLNI